MVSKRRGFVAVMSDFAGDATGSIRSPALGMRHDLLAISVHDPRELDVPPIGLVTSSTRRPGGVARSASRRPCSAASPRPPPRRSSARRFAVRRAGADLIELATDSDWLAAIVSHVTRRRTQAVNAQVLRR